MSRAKGRRALNPPRRRGWCVKPTVKHDVSTADGPTRYEHRGVPTVETRGLMVRAILGARVWR